MCLCLLIVSVDGVCLSGLSIVCMSLLTLRICACLSLFIEVLELPAKLQNYFSRSNKSNINRCEWIMCTCLLIVCIFDAYVPVDCVCVPVHWAYELSVCVCWLYFLSTCMCRFIVSMCIVYVPFDCVYFLCVCAFNCVYLLHVDCVFLLCVCVPVNWALHHESMPVYCGYVLLFYSVHVLYVCTHAWV